MCVYVHTPSHLEKVNRWRLAGNAICGMKVRMGVL